MLTVDKLIARGRGLAPALVRRAPSVTLDWDTRCKSRFEAVDSDGRRLGVFLPRGATVRGGDVLIAADGSLVRVVATPQPVMVVRPCAAHGSAFDLLRAAYHLGNRHVALELQPDRLLFEPDPVLADMLRRMHLIVTEETAPFEPEAGAYGTAHAHGHARAEHGHDRGHDPAHGHGPAHVHDHAHGRGHGQDPAPDHIHDPAHHHVHAPGHDHGHGHRHGHAHGHPRHDQRADDHDD